MGKSVADQIVETLAAAGVKRVYGVVGDSLNALTESLRRQREIEWVATRHEEVAAFAAGAEAQVSGELTVCAGSCGPGHLHLINGLYDCHRSRTPVLAIAAHIPSAEIGTGYFQETRPELLFRDCSHYCELVAKPEQLVRTLSTAIRHALSRRGVSVVVLPGDVALEAAEDVPPVSPWELLFVPPSVVPSAGEVERMAALLNDAKRVTMLCGIGCAGAQNDVRELAYRLQAPIVAALRGKELFEPFSEHYVGLTGLIGTASGYYAMNDCDTLLLLGTDFPYRQFYPDSKDTRIIQVDIRPENLGKRARIDLGVVGDVASTVARLLPKVAQKSDESHLSRALHHHRQVSKELDLLASPGDPPIHPQQLAQALSDHAAPDAIFTCDVGLPTVWAARHVRMNGQRRLLGSFNHGSMANAMAQAIGAQKACPDRQVIALAGDGGFTMLMGDFLSLVQHQLPVKVVVFNNGSLGFVELEQRAAGLLDTGTTLDNPDFAALARAMRVHALRVEGPSQVEPAVRELLGTKGPALLDVVVNREELSIPPKITAAMAKGFTLFMVKALLNGRTDTVLELVRTNFWR